VRVGNTTIRRLILEERKQFRQGSSALQPKVYTRIQSQNTFISRDVYKVNVVYFLEHNVFDFI
jgi:hypothetical protein